MKRIIMMIFLFVLMIALTGCMGTEEAISSTVLAELVPVTAQEPTDPPAMLTMESEDDYLLLYRASLLSEEELPQYERYEELLDLYQLGCLSSFPGTTLKSNVDAAVDMIEKMSPYFPQIDASQVQYACLNIYPRDGYFDLMYYLNDGLRYMLTIWLPNQGNNTVMNDVMVSTPMFRDQKFGPYEIDLYAYKHMGVRDYLIGEYVTNGVKVKVMIDALKEGDTLSLDQFYFGASDTE